MIPTVTDDRKSIILENYTCEKIGLNLSKFEIPPFIGCFIADKDGKTLLKFEIFEHALEFFLKSDSKEDKNCLDVELIPMFISALERFSAEITLKI